MRLERELIRQVINAEVERDLANRELTTLRAENAALRASLEGIYESRNACGCWPICRCNDNVPALLAWKEATLDDARAALAKEGGK